jgi:hypothetical protein
MNKADLKQKWSKYCDTDKLVVNMMALLKKHGSNCTEHGVCVALDTYFTNKEPLIKMISGSKNYIGDMRIAVQKEFDRQMNNDTVHYFINEFERTFSPRILLTDKDEDGKSFSDYFNTGKNSFVISSLPSEEEQTSKLEKMRKFDYSRFYLMESLQKYTAYDGYLNAFRYVKGSTIALDIKYGDGPELKKGTKTSRAFNHVCTHYGIDKMFPETVTTVREGQTIERTVYPYDKIFAQFADLVSDLKRKLYFVISLNPLDYLTMSVGVNWRSCHHIDGGSWRGGCMSYMLDKVSMITYVIPTLEGDIHMTPKHYRQMFHYKNSLFVQNRLYPQGNDGATDLYEKFRGFVIDEFCPLLGVDKDWRAYPGTQARVDSVGVHYRDYGNNRKCAIFFPHSRCDDALNQRMTIGHEGICVRCGHTYSDSYGFEHRNRNECSR